MGRMHRTLRPVALALAATLAPAQHDLRDTVTLTGGKELRGRILTPHHPDTLTVAIGGKRERVPLSRIASTHSISDDLTELLSRRRAAIDNPKLRMFLAEWAATKSLPEMARLLALEVVLEDPAHAAAHRLLGHRKHERGWLWRFDDRWLTREQVEAAMADGTAMTIESEHWQIVVGVGLIEAVRALFDLEHLYGFWHREFGEALQLQEALTRLEIRVAQSSGTFSRWGQDARPYYVPRPFGDYATTFYPDLAPTRPSGLFFCGTQHILYHCLMDTPRMQTDRDRVCAWLEIGLGRYAEQAMVGDPGLAKGRRPAPGSSLDAHNGLAWPGNIENLIHLPMYPSFYMRAEYVTDTNWGAASSFCRFLLEHPDKGIRARFLTYVRDALQRGKGDSSKAFDNALGQEIEAFESAWRAAALKVARLGG